MRHISICNHISSETAGQEDDGSTKQDQKQAANGGRHRCGRGGVNLRGADGHRQLIAGGERAGGLVARAGLVCSHERLDDRRGRLAVPRGVPIQQPRQAHEVAVIALLLLRLRRRRRRGVAPPTQLRRRKNHRQRVSKKFTATIFFSSTHYITEGQRFLWR